MSSISQEQKIKREKKLKEVRKRFNLKEEKSYLDYLKEKAKKDKYYKKILEEIGR